jgi:hypothetical protein
LGKINFFSVVASRLRQRDFAPRIRRRYRGRLAGVGGSLRSSRLTRFEARDVRQGQGKMLAVKNVKNILPCRRFFGVTLRCGA